MDTAQFVILIVLLAVVAYRARRPVEVVHDVQTFYEPMPQDPVDIDNLEQWLEAEIRQRNAIVASRYEADAYLGKGKYKVLETLSDGRLLVKYHSTPARPQWQDFNPDLAEVPAINFWHDVH